MFSFESLAFLISSLLVLTLFYFKVHNNVFQQATALFLVLTLIFLTRFVFPHTQVLSSKKPRLLLLFLSSALVQFLIISTGGFYSPFLILLHLYTLGTSFLLNSRAPMIFLILTFITLIANILTNPQLMAIFRNDPGPTILYSLSFIAIIPIAQYLIYSYNLKSTLLGALKEYAKIGEKREGSILVGLSEMVIVTDKNLNIVSTNEAVEKTLKLPPEGILNHNIFSVLPLTDRNGKLIDPKSIFSEEMAGNVAKFINNLYFQSKKVNIQVRPIANSEGKISQVVFMMTDDSSAQIEEHSDLAYARQKYQLLSRDLKQTLARANLLIAATKINLLEKIEEDLLLAAELEDHPVPQTLDFYDIAHIAKQASLNKQKLAASLGVNLQFELSDDYASEKAMMDLIDSNMSKKQLPVSDFSVSTNKKWAEVILQKLIDIAILLASEKKNQIVKVAPNLFNNALSIDISFQYHTITAKEQEEIFQQYYGDLGMKTNLRLGSGLEGFIAKTIASKLDIPIKVTSLTSSSQITFSLNFTKAAGHA